VYKPVGSYVPVDPDGNPIGPKTPYTNDPNDPSKVTGNNTPVTPDGYDPQNPDGTNNTYTPNDDPTKDTEQPFTKSKTPEPETPETPETPAEPKQPGTREVPIYETRTQVVEGYETVYSRERVRKVRQTLPETGDESNAATAATVGGVLMATLGLSGLARRKKRDE
ncbi:LPXTG cell wall anchor domain-containing protein, partial [Streptococcus sp. zg-JUN1979]|uniref:LPXTG cell wall anchor domain-containing protein n=1 Tax=Streptococcus sp. zg-JUN1979 TaxID=3391450 RepID=UPI0039A65E68